MRLPSHAALCQMSDSVVTLPVSSFHATTLTVTMLSLTSAVHSHNREICAGLNGRTQL